MILSPNLSKSNYFSKYGTKYLMIISFVILEFNQFSTDEYLDFLIYLL